jgi:hypothetical protein
MILKFSGKKHIFITIISGKEFCSTNVLCLCIKSFEPLKCFLCELGAF